MTKLHHITQSYNHDTFAYLDDQTDGSRVSFIENTSDHPYEISLPQV